MVCVVGRMRDLILQLSKSSIYSTKPSVSISCPSCSASDGVVRNGKSTAGHQRYLCSHCRKTWQLQFTYTASQPGTHQKIIDMAMNGVGCRATARIMGVGLNTILRHLKTQAAVGNLAHTAGQ